MSARVRNVEDRRFGNFYVEVNLDGQYTRFETAMQVNEWLASLKELGGDIAEIFVDWLDVVITPKKEFVYRTNYVL